MVVDLEEFLGVSNVAFRKSQKDAVWVRYIFLTVKISNHDILVVVEEVLFWVIRQEVSDKGGLH